ncbi:MAG TPA: hypothetical protein VMJ66_07370 [Geobacteraceae bacterium]|nr:hypothetical protein [Geobacteraceae bacterium]
MRCDYKDKFSVDYSGSLHITRGDGVDLTVRGSDIPSDFRDRFESAVSHNSCHELRSAAKAFTDTIHDAFDKE